MSLKYEPSSEPLHIFANRCQPRPSEEGKNKNVLTTFTVKQRPATGLDCLVYAEFARQRSPAEPHARDREFVIDNLLVRILFIIVLIRWTGLAPWEFEFPFPGGRWGRQRSRRWTCTDQTPSTSRPGMPQTHVIHACLCFTPVLKVFEGSLPPFNHKPTYTVHPIVHRARLFPGRRGADAGPVRTRRLRHRDQACLIPFMGPTKSTALICHHTRTVVITCIYLYYIVFISIISYLAAL